MYSISQDVQVNLDRCYEGAEHRFPHNKICKAKRASRNHPITLFDKLLIMSSTNPYSVEHVIGY